MFIYQIGNNILRGYSDMSSSLVAMDNSFVSSNDDVLRYTKDYRQIEKIQINVTGNITEYNGISPYTQLNNLVRDIGKVHMDIVGYMPKSCKTPYTYENTVDEEVQWFHTYGTILNVQRALGFTDNTDPDDIMQLNITLVINPYWEPLNPYLWHADYTFQNGIKTFQQLKNYSTPLVANNLPKYVDYFQFDPEFIFYKFIIDDNDKYELLFKPLTYWSGWSNSSFLFKTGNVTLTNPAITQSVNVNSQYSGLIDAYYVISGLDSLDGTNYTVNFSYESEPTSFSSKHSGFTYVGQEIMNSTVLADHNLFISNKQNPMFFDNSTYDVVLDPYGDFPYVPLMNFTTPKLAQLESQNNTVTFRLLRDTGGTPSVTIHYLFVYKVL